MSMLNGFMLTTAMKREQKCEIGGLGFEALLIGQVPNFPLYRDDMAAAALAVRIPTMTPQIIFTETGCLLSYSTKPEPIYRNFAGYVKHVLDGEKPGDLPVQQASDFELALNLKTAAALGTQFRRVSWLGRTDSSSRI